MRPDAKSHDLLYVSNWISGAVTIYTYPGGALAGVLTGFTQPYGECVDRSGNVFIANFNASDIVEYPHGSPRPIATIADPGEHPSSCAVNPKTGALAVNNSYASGNKPGSVAIYRYGGAGSWGTPTLYSDWRFAYMYFCGYDASGNLFVDGTTVKGYSFLAELPAGGKKLVKIQLDQKINIPGGVQSDGSDMTVGDSALNPAVIYRFTVSGDKGQVVGSTTLDGNAAVVQYWIDGAKIVGPQPRSSTVTIWHYPAGGSPIQTISDSLDSPGGLTISPAPKR